MEDEDDVLYCEPDTDRLTSSMQHSSSDDVNVTKQNSSSGSEFNAALLKREFNILEDRFFKQEYSDEPESENETEMILSSNQNQRNSLVYDLIHTKEFSSYTYEAKIKVKNAGNC